MNKIVERIEREAGVPGLASILAERLAPTDLQSLLLEVYRIRSTQRHPADVLLDFRADRFVRPSTVSPRKLLSWEQMAFSLLPPEFQSVELAPVCPLGTSSVIASVDQNWAVTTARNTEVVSDATNVLALECALRRRNLLRVNSKSAEPVHLAASHRVLRAQRYDSPQSVTHFSLFALCSAGRSLGSAGFELAALQRHIQFYLNALRAFLGPEVSLRVAVTDFRGTDRYPRLESELLSPIRAGHEQVECVIDEGRTSGRGYYADLCFHVHVMDPTGHYLEIADGGSVDWTQRLLSSAKERLIISGVGSERLCSVF